MNATSDTPPEWFDEALSPIVRRDPNEFTEDDARDYWLILRIVPERWLRTAALKHLSESESPYMPQPATLLRIARSLQRQTISARFASLPPCDLCGTEGIVWVPSPTNRLRSDGFACTCERGLIHRHLPKYREGITTEAEAKRLSVQSSQECLPVGRATAAIGNIPKPPSKKELMRGLATWHRGRLTQESAGALPAKVDESDSGV